MAGFIVCSLIGLQCYFTRIDFIEMPSYNRHVYDEFQIMFEDVLPLNLSFLMREGICYRSITSGLSLFFNGLFKLDLS